MADDYIYPVRHLARDNDRSLICRCPHCQRVIGLEGDDLEDVEGEQYTCRCGGMFEVETRARMVRGELPPNRGIPG